MPRAAGAFLSLPSSPLLLLPPSRAALFGDRWPEGKDGDDEDEDEDEDEDTTLVGIIKCGTGRGRGSVPLGARASASSLLTTEACFTPLFTFHSSRINSCTEIVVICFTSRVPTGLSQTTASLCSDESGGESGDCSVEGGVLVGVLPSCKVFALLHHQCSPCGVEDRGDRASITPKDRGDFPSSSSKGKGSRSSALSPLGTSLLPAGREPIIFGTTGPTGLATCGCVVGCCRG